jgi:hypothetical protein
LLPRYATVISDSKKFIMKKIGKKIDGGAPSKLSAAARGAFYHGGGGVMKMTAAAAWRRRRPGLHESYNVDQNVQA